MREGVMLNRAEPRKILKAVIEQGVPAIMSYLSKGKWHVAKVLLSDIRANTFNAEIMPQTKTHPMNIQIGQPAGMSLKYGYGKFIFETTIVNLEPSQDPTTGGVIVLAVPDKIELIQKRNYFRVKVPKSQDVDVSIWHCSGANDNRLRSSANCWNVRLVDISAGGVQIAINAKDKGNFKLGQFIRMRFVPGAFEQPLMFNAQIRTTLPTADENNICLGLQIVGLEASPQGRKILQRLVEVVERYYQLSRSKSK